MTGDRVEAAAKALAGRLTAATQVIVTQRQYVSGMSIRAAKSQAAEILAAADEADRVAGVVRIDTNDPAAAGQIIYALRAANWHRTDTTETAQAILIALRASDD